MMLQIEYLQVRTAVACDALRKTGNESHIKNLLYGNWFANHGNSCTGCFTTQWFVCIFTSGSKPFNN
ncbi:MAG: hypothetical protein ACHQFX_17305 [Chitinophagales bacterium]